jgi:hypothetical protein
MLVDPLVLSIDRANFSYCQRNHVSFNLTATQLFGTWAKEKS